jgi:murein DD-endopeptidase MepM/ murein hydrolase activator NlpD
MGVHLGVLLALLVCTNAFASGDTAPEQSYPFTVESQKEGDGYRVVAFNGGPAPVSVKVSIRDFEGITTDRATPLFTEVGPGDQPVVLLRVQRAVKGEPYTFRTFSTWMVGQVDAAQAKDAEYRLPFENRQEYAFSQFPGGPISTHTAPVSRYAVDIAMPEGTVILAARGGLIISTEGGQRVGAPDPALLDKANEVRILHADGTIATYAHLAHEGVFVVPGQRVAAGGAIGVAGSTGFSSGPHLHLAIQTVKRIGDEFALVSLPFGFVNGTPLAAFTPRYGVPARAEYDAPEPVGVRAVVPAVGTSGDAHLLKVSMPPQQGSSDEDASAWTWLAGVTGFMALASLFRKANNQKGARLNPDKSAFRQD